MTTEHNNLALTVAGLKTLLPDLFTAESPATLVVILDEILNSLTALSQSFKDEPLKQPVQVKSFIREIHIEDIEAWHKGGREQYWPRTSLSQFTTIIRLVEKFYKAREHG